MQFKIVLAGDGRVGKTSVRRRFLGKVFKADYIPTLGVDFAPKSVVVGTLPVLLVIWDIAGQPLYQGLRKRYYDGCSSIILVYSVVDRASFENASEWLVEVFQYIGRVPPLAIVGNKTDLRSSEPPEKIFTTEEGRSFARAFSVKMNTTALFIETSALTGENIEKLFLALTETMIERSRRTPALYSNSLGFRDRGMVG
jgi:small GTP-binding protein